MPPVHTAGALGLAQVAQEEVHRLTIFKDSILTYILGQRKVFSSEISLSSKPRVVHSQLVPLTISGVQVVFQSSDERDMLRCGAVRPPAYRGRIQDILEARKRLHCVRSDHSTLGRVGWRRLSTQSPIGLISLIGSIH